MGLHSLRSFSVSISEILHPEVMKEIGPSTPFTLFAYLKDSENWWQKLRGNPYLEFFYSASLVAKTMTGASHKAFVEYLD